MSQISLDLLTLFVRTPGDFLFFLLMVVVSQVSLLMALGHRMRQPEHRASARYTLAMAGVVVGWLLLLAGALFSVASDQDTVLILPPLERAVTTASLLLVGWVFLTADHTRRERAATILVMILLAVTAGGYLLTGVTWTSVAGSIPFNLTAYGVAWAFVAAILCVLGLVLLLLFFRDVIDAPLKMLFFLLLLPGYAGTLLLTVRGELIGDYSGLVRLAFTLAMAIVPLVIYRMILRQMEAEMESVRRIAQHALSNDAARTRTRQEVAVVPDGAEQPRLSPIESQPIQLLKSLGLILEATAPEAIPDQIVLSAIDVLRTDIGALLRFQDANYADITGAYDRVMRRSLSGIVLNLDDQPTLVNALERREQRALYPDRNEMELQDLFTRLDIEQIGPVYFQPLIRKQEIVAVLLVGLPYAGREFNRSERELLKGFGIISSNLLALSYAAIEARDLAEDRTIQAMVEGVSPETLEESEIIAARRELQQNLKLAREQIGSLSRQVMELKIQLDDERSRMATLLGGTEEGLSISQRIVAINEEHIRLREDRDRLMTRLQETEAAISGATADSDEAMVNDLVQSLRRERENLAAERDRLQQQLDDLRAQDEKLLPAEVDKFLQQMTQERNRLADERDQLRDKLGDLQSQLEALGVDEGVSGLSQLISELYHERATLKSQLEKFQSERDTLLSERSRIADRITHEKERDDYVHALEQKMQNLAADREAVFKQRDKLRSENEELREKVNVVKEHRARLLAKASGMEIEIEELHEEQSHLRATVQELADTRSELIDARDRLMAEKQALELSYNQLRARLEDDPALMQQFGEEGVDSMRQMIEGLSSERNRLNQQLNEAQKAASDLESKLDQTERELENLRLSNQTYSPKYPDLLVGLVQELRTPMTSLTGYVDLLLGESAGILGEMQRKFLQRVSANISRLEVMIDDLVNVAQLDTGQFRLQPAPVNVVNLIEDAITAASVQFREKGLVVNLELDDELPPVPADKDALNQIIGQLLTNAYLVTPPDSDIQITARADERRIDADSPATERVVYVAVEDRGGGIPPEDVPRVFARKYKAENPLIQGLGDTGVGLSIAKALVEAHGGRLWVETKAGTGSVFCFLLPLDTELQAEG